MKTHLSAYLLFALYLFIIGCSGAAQNEPENADTGNLPARVNYTFSPVQLNVAEDHGQRFYSGIMKLTMQIGPGGILTLDQNQEPLHAGFQFDARCPDVPTVVNDIDPFHRRAEIYLMTHEVQAKPGAFVEINGLRKQIKTNAGCVYVSGRNDLFLVPYLSDGATIRISGLGTYDFTSQIPVGLVPYVLVRYNAGQVVPAPARLDAVILEPEMHRVMLTYRSTFRAQPEVRKAEFRLIHPDKETHASKGETREQTLKRTQYVRKFLKACPVPDAPGEPCVGPGARVNVVTLE